MANNIDEVDSKNWKSLVRISDKDLKGSDREDKGKAYSAILEELQIRPEVHEAFFEGNIRPFRNKKDSAILIAKSDDESLLKLSKLYLSAYGKIVWGTERNWLFGDDQLSSDETQLRFIKPKDRQDGDHDRFYQSLAKLWRQMRSIIFELRPSLRRNYNFVDTTTPDSVITTPSTQRRLQYPATAFDPIMPTRSGAEFLSQTPLPQPATRQQAIVSVQGQQQANAPDQDYRPRRPWVHWPAPPNEVSVPGYWLASRTERVILDAITDLAIAKAQSHPEVFETLWQRHVARIHEMDQYEVQQQAGLLTISGGNSSTIDQDNEDTPMVDTPSPNQPAPTSDLTTTAKNQTISCGTNTEPTINISHSSHHRIDMPPTFPLTSYVPPTMPQILTVYITPLSHAATHLAQPYIWPDAPVHSTSYNSFRNGVRSRANVPASVADDKVVMVLGYGWNDFSSVVSGEASWKNWFMQDLRRAAEKGGVSVWRMKVSVVVS